MKKKEGRESQDTAYIYIVILQVPGPIIRQGASNALGNDIVPFLIQTGTRKSLLEQSREANHVEQRPLLGLTSLVL